MILMPKTVAWAGLLFNGEEPAWAGPRQEVHCVITCGEYGALFLLDRHIEFPPVPEDGYGVARLFREPTGPGWYLDVPVRPYLQSGDTAGVTRGPVEISPDEAWRRAISESTTTEDIPHGS